MARKYSPKYSARRDSLSFFVHSADNFYSKAVVRYNEFYGDQFASEFEDIHSRKHTNEIECSIIKVNANSESWRVFVENTNQNSSTEEHGLIENSQNSNDNETVESTKLESAIAKATFSSTSDKEAVVSSGENKTVDISPECISSIKGRIAAGAEVITISLVWSTCKVSVVGEVDYLEWFKTQEFPTLQSDELTKSKCQVKSTPKKAIKTKNTMKRTAPSPKPDTETANARARQLNIEQTFNKLDEGVTDIRNEMFPLVEEVRMLKAFVVNANEKNFELNKQVICMASLIHEMKEEMNKNEKNMIEQFQSMLAVQTQELSASMTQQINALKHNKPEEEEDEQEEVVIVKEDIVNLNMMVNVEEWKERDGNLYIGRKSHGFQMSKWRNPFRVDDCEGGRAESLVLFEKYIRQEKHLMDSINELEGKQLGCFCKPEGCHGDILLKILQESKEACLEKQTTQPKNATYSQIVAQPHHHQQQEIGNQMRGSNLFQSPQPKQNYHHHKQFNRPQSTQQDKYKNVHQGRYKQEQNFQQHYKYQPQQTSKSQQPQTNRRAVKVLMDSNRNCINFENVFPREDVQVLKCGTTPIARQELGRGFRSSPTDIILHTGTNDIETSDPRAVAEQIMANAAEAAEHYKCHVVVSALPPRSDGPNDERVRQANKWIQQLREKIPRYASITVSENKDISSDHLSDSKHLGSNHVRNGRSGVQMLAANLHKAVYKEDATEALLNTVVRKDPPFFVKRQRYRKY